MAKAKQMSFAEAKTVYGDDFKIKQTVREMRARGGSTSKNKNDHAFMWDSNIKIFLWVLHYPKESNNDPDTR